VAAPHLHQAQSHHDPEIATRAKKLYQQWAWQVADTIKPTNWAYVPWIDSLPQDYPNRCDVIQNHLSLADGDNDAPTWSKYRNATKLLVYELLCQGKSLSEVNALLHTMVAREKCWIKNSQHAYKFPEALIQSCD
jgi:hypothetical protein